MRGDSPYDCENYFVPECCRITMPTSLFVSFVTFLLCNIAVIIIQVIIWLITGLFTPIHLFAAHHFILRMHNSLYARVLAT